MDEEFSDVDETGQTSPAAELHRYCQTMNSYQATKSKDECTLCLKKRTKFETV